MTGVNIYQDGVLVQSITQQANTFTYTQTFNAGSSPIVIYNPAGTHTYTLTPAAITSNLLMTLPLLKSNFTLTAVGASTSQFNPGNPNGTTSASYVMMGLGASVTFTPAQYPQIRITCTGSLGVNTAGGIGVAQLVIGTGAAPGNGVAFTGTAVGSAGAALTGVTGAGTFTVSFTCDGIVGGLTPGTTYWIDLRMLAGGAATASVFNLNIVIQELQY